MDDCKKCPFHKTEPVPEDLVGKVNLTEWSFCDVDAVGLAAADRIANQNTHILALQKEIEKLRGQVPRWIPVTERLPDAPGHYLICTSINYWHGGCLDKNEERKHYNHCGTPMRYEGTTKSALDCYYDVTGSWNRVCDIHVTHWMPLPEPPEVENAKTE